MTQIWVISEKYQYLKTRNWNLSRLFSTSHKFVIKIRYITLRVCRINFGDKEGCMFVLVYSKQVHFSLQNLC